VSGPRDQVLGAIRRGLMRAVLPNAEAMPPQLPRTAAPDQPALLRQFEQTLIALTGRVHHATSAGEAADLIAAVAAEHGAQTFLSWDGAELGTDGLLEALSAHHLSRIAYDLSFDAARRAADAPGLGDVVIGLTGSDAAIADAGAIVLASGPGRGRLASLLPPVHVAIVSATRIHPTLPALLAERPELVGRGANLVVIAGPSRTADIEMTLTHGVHGPRHLHVILMP
jgi:L-lactate dehydrogenase complex protein LldG